MSIDITLDADDFTAKLTDLQELRVDTAIKRTVNEVAEDLRNITPRRTGKLVDSIRQSVGKSEGEVGFTSEYAPHVEYGHRQNVGQYVTKLGKRLKAPCLKAPYVEGQHFFSREMEATRRVLKKRIQDLLREGGM